MWTEMFRLAVPVAEKLARPVIIYMFLVAAIRLFGKRELSQLNPFDFVVLLTLSNTIQNAIIGDDTTITGGVISATVLLMTNALLVRFLYRHPQLDQLVEGQADELIAMGVVRKDRLDKELITLAELEGAAHKQGFASLAEVDRAVLEPGGGISFFAKQPPIEAERHAELLARFDKLSQQIAALRT